MFQWGSRGCGSFFGDRDPKTAVPGIPGPGPVGCSGHAWGLSADGLGSIDGPDVQRSVYPYPTPV